MSMEPLSLRDDGHTRIAQAGDEQDPEQEENGDNGAAMSDEELISTGEQVYDDNCATCHQPDGQGSGGYPALAGNSFVTADDPSGVIEIVTNGRGSMPSFGDQLEPEEIAAVASYVRNSWENEASVVQVADVTGDAPAQDQPAEETEQAADAPEEETAEEPDSQESAQPAGDQPTGQGQAEIIVDGNGSTPIRIQVQVIVVTPTPEGQQPAATPTPEPATEDTATEDTATEDTATEDAATEDAATEDAATEDAATEDAATEDAATEDAATDQPEETQSTAMAGDLPQIGSALTPSGTLPGEPAIQLVKVVEGLVDPINVTYAPDGSGRTFVVERIGRIRIIQDGQLLEEPFLDISEIVKIDFLEQGLLGAAFHPDYSNNGRFFVYYSDFRTNGDSYVVEYQVSDDDPNVADPDSARVLLTQDQPFTNHNGGTIAFGPDGYLYISLGDGGLAGDPYRNAQNLETLLGTLLRIDVDAETEEGYAIPEDNPYPVRRIVSDQANAEAQDGSYVPNARPEIWAWGLRNAWQFSFDRETGDLFIADVGQAGWEEINVQPADSEGGINYGWPILEGSHCFVDEDCGVFGELPVAEYANPDAGCSITGVGVYRGEEFPSLDGIYFASDYCTGRFWGLTRGEGEDEWHFAEMLHTELVVTGAGADEAGNLYVTTCTCQFGRNYDPYEQSNGMIWQIVAADQVPEGAEVAPLRE
jgi:glucose/arabinose dehydrogenase/cytochrome c5